VVGLKKSEFQKLWTTKSPAEIAAEIGGTRQEVYRIAKKFGLPPRSVVKPNVEFNPSRKEIRRMTAEFREQWSDEEEQKRRVGPQRESRRWSVPQVEFSMKPASFSSTYL
jgi:hypothetical protein